MVQSNKKLEWGAGVLSFRGNHYRGSDQAKNYFYPLPYFVYTSEKIEAEPSFIRGTFYKNDWFALKLSIIVGLNVESEKNNARKGMSEIDYTFEAGPMVIFKLFQSQDKTHTLNFEVPFRQVHATDLTYIDPIGFFAVPYLNYIRKATSAWYNWSMELSVAAMWGSRKYHDYYYGVSPQFATNERPSYRGQAGYSGIQTTIVFNKRWKELVFVPFFRWDQLSGVAFNDSPLFKKPNYFIGGLGFFWLFGG